MTTRDPGHSGKLRAGLQNVADSLPSRPRELCGPFDSGTTREKADIVDRLLHAAGSTTKAKLCAEAATEIASLRRELDEAREILAAALDEWEGHNGPLTDPTDPHWSNDARRALSASKEG